MNPSPISLLWLQVVAVLAVEVGLIALVVALVSRLNVTTARRRTFCQIGVSAALVVTACELSGSARYLVTWPTRILAGRSIALPPPGVSQTRQAGIPDTSTANPRELPTAELELGTLTLSPSTAPGTQKDYPTAEARHHAPAATPPAGAPALPVILTAEATRYASRVTDHGSRVTDFRSANDSFQLLWIVVIWAIGSTLVASRVCLAQCLFFLYRRRRRALTDPRLLRRVEELARALGISGPVRVVESARLSSPIAYGLLRPTIGLPPDFGARFDHARQDAVLIHELAHLAARDPLWCRIADAATIVLWWHPGVWWLRRQLRLASEMAADEASLLVANGPRVLAECLVELGARLSRPTAFGALQVSGFRSHLGRRVQRLVHLEERRWSPPDRRRVALMTFFGPMALAAVVLLCTAWAAPQAITKGDSMNAMNWKRTWAAVTLLAAAGGPEATLLAAQPEIPPAPSVPAPAAQAEAAPAIPVPPPPSVGAPPPAAPADANAAADAFRRRYGLAPGPIVPVAAPAPPASEDEQSKRGAKLEARLKQILMPEIAIDGLPLNEVLRLLSDESLKRDPEKVGVNFLINPNSPPVALTGAMDPATGLPVATPGEALAMSSVLIQFNLPLRNVSMKDVLDAIVTVADHPIEYKIEDYAVIFSAKPQMVSGQPVRVAPTTGSLQAQPRIPARPFTPRPQSQLINPAQQGEPPWQPTITREALSDTKPQTFDVDFGSPVPSEQVGPAAAGRPGDFWNPVSEGFNDHYTRSGLKFANGEPSPIAVEMINLGGGWGCTGQMGVKAPMLDHFNYPTGNRGGNSTVILHQVPPGKYSVYIYGHGTTALYYGDYTLTVGSQSYGRKQTSHKLDAVRNTKWVEGSQYVKFSNVKVPLGEDVIILIQPGGLSSDASGRTFTDAMIAGLQLIPAK